MSTCVRCRRCQQEMSKRISYSHFIYCNDFEYDNAGSESDPEWLLASKYYCLEKPKNNPLKYKYDEQFEEVKK